MAGRQACSTASLAAVVAVALALVIVVNSQTVPSPSIVIPMVNISIQNDFPNEYPMSRFRKLTINCHNGIPAQIVDHVVAPTEAYTFRTNTELVDWWKCHIRLGVRGDDICKVRYRGLFLVWERNLTRNAAVPATTTTTTASVAQMCSTECRWFVNATGLSLLPQSKRELVHVYDWPHLNCTGANS